MGTNTFIGNIALLLFVLMASAAAMALDVNGPGCKSCIRYLAGATNTDRLAAAELDCYAPFADVTGCNRADGTLDCSHITYISSEVRGKYTAR